MSSGRHTYIRVSKAQSRLQKTTFLGPVASCAFHLTCLTTRTISVPHTPADILWNDLRFLLCALAVLPVCLPSSLSLFSLNLWVSVSFPESLPFPSGGSLSGFGGPVTEGLREVFSPLPLAVADSSSLYFHVFLSLSVSLCLPFPRRPGTALA